MTTVCLASCQQTRWEPTNIGVPSFQTGLKVCSSPTRHADAILQGVVLFPIKARRIQRGMWMTEPSLDHIARLIRLTRWGLCPE